MLTADAALAGALHLGGYSRRTVHIAAEDNRLSNCEGCTNALQAGRAALVSARCQPLLQPG